MEEQGPGVVVIVGAPERLRGHLDESGVLDGHPYRAFFPMGHLPSCGTAVYARVPVEEVADSPVPAVRLEVEGGPVVLVPADVPGPQDGVAAWKQEIAALGEAAAGQMVAGWPVVVAGDFNAVREHLPFRRLVEGGLDGGGSAGGGPADGESTDAGLVNAAEAAGGGWMPTYRADRPPLPPVLEITCSSVVGLRPGRSRPCAWTGTRTSRSSRGCGWGSDGLTGRSGGGGTPGGGVDGHAAWWTGSAVRVGGHA